MNATIEKFGYPGTLLREYEHVALAKGVGFSIEVAADVPASLPEEPRTATTSPRSAT